MLTAVRHSQTVATGYTFNCIATRPHLRDIQYGSRKTPTRLPTPSDDLSHRIVEMDGQSRRSDLLNSRISEHRYYGQPIVLKRSTFLLKTVHWTICSLKQVVKRL